MSKFSEYLKQLIQSRNLSISKLARESGVERTSLHKALSGERILSYQALELLVQYMEISPRESQKLYQYFNLLFESEGVRKARDTIDKIFCRLSELPDNPGRGERFFHGISLPGIKGEGDTYNGYGEVSRLIQCILAEEMKCGKPRVEMTAPPDMQVMRESIERIYTAEADMMISHVICLEASVSENKYNIHNLKFLGYVLPCCILSNQKYDVYYYYNDKIQTRYMDPLPYFLVTHLGAVCFSENFQTAILLRGEEQIAYFRACFYQLKKFCHRLIAYTEATESGLCQEETRLRGTENGCLITGKSFSLRIPVKKQTVAFTRNSVFAFLQTGKMRDFLAGTAEVVSEEKRMALLEYFADNIREDCTKARLINNQVFTIPDNLAVWADGDVCVISCERQSDIRIEIREHNLRGAFYDWGLHFSGSDCVFDKERTVEVLAEIGQLWQRAGN